MQLTIFILYLVGMMAVGIYFYFRTKNMEDFALGGRSVGPLPSGVSSVTSDMSGWLLLGLPGVALSAGMDAAWISIGLFIGFAAAWFIIARPLREETERLENSITIPTFLERKLGDPTGFLRLSLAIAILFFFVFYVSGGLVAGSKLFQSVFGLPRAWGIVIIFVAVIGYTFLGGYLAVTWTDVIQGCLMLIGLLVIPIMAIQQFGGLPKVIETINQESPNHLSLFTEVSGSRRTLLAILSNASWGFGYLGIPHIVVRYMGIKSPDKVPVAGTIAVVYVGVLMLMAVTSGLLGVAFFADSPLEDPEQVYLLLVNTVSHPVIGGLLLAAVVSAIMSTADSQLLVASTALTVDMITKKLDSKKQLLYSRLTVLAVAVLALLLSFNENASVQGIVSYAWSGLAATCGAPLLLALTWKKTTYQGGIAGVIVGAVITVGWKLLADSGGVFLLYELLPAFVFACVAVVVVSLATQGKKAVVQPA